MNLTRLDNETCPQHQRNMVLDKPTIRISKKGKVYVSKQAVIFLEIGSKDKFALAQDEQTTKFYIYKDPKKGFLLKMGDKNHQAYFSNMALCEMVFDAYDFDKDKESSIVFEITDKAKRQAGVVYYQLFRLGVTEEEEKPEKKKSPKKKKESKIKRKYTKKKKLDYVEVLPPKKPKKRGPKPKIKVLVTNQLNPKDNGLVEVDKDDIIMDEVGKEIASGGNYRSKVLDDLKEESLEDDFDELNPPEDEDEDDIIRDERFIGETKPKDMPTIKNTPLSQIDKFNQKYNKKPEPKKELPEGYNNPESDNYIGMVALSAMGEKPIRK